MDARHKSLGLRSYGQNDALVESQGEGYGVFFFASKFVISAAQVDDIVVEHLWSGVGPRKGFDVVGTVGCDQSIGGVGSSDGVVAGAHLSFTVPKFLELCFS